MSSTMLQLSQQVITELGTRASPTAVAGSTDTDLVQILALMNAVGYELQREYQWQALTTEYRFTTTFYSYTGITTNGSPNLTGMSSIVGLTTNPSYFQVTGTGINQDTYLTAAVGNTVTMSQNATASSVTAETLTFSQTKYAMPSDYDRLIDGTDWDKSKHWQMLGPETMQQKEWLKSGYISTGPRIRYYLMGNLFQIWPPLGTNEYLGFDYVSNLWVTATGGAAPTKTSFTVDTDTCIFPDRVMTLGTKLKYFEIKGFDTSALYRDYTTQKDIAKAADGGSPTLSFAPLPSQILINWNNIPDSGYGT